VGTGRYDSNWLRQLVGCLSQRLVLNTVRSIGLPKHSTRR
jgi:hypothetical protein